MKLNKERQKLYMYNVKIIKKYKKIRGKKIKNNIRSRKTIIKNNIE